MDVAGSHGDEAAASGMRRAALIAELEKERDDAKLRADAAEKELNDMKADKAKKDAEETEKKAIEAAEKEKADKADQA